MKQAGKIKITAITIMIMIIVLLMIIAGAALAGGNYNVSAFSNLDAADKIRNAQKQGAEVKLSSAELNGIINTYLKNKVKKGTLEVKGIEAMVTGSKISFRIPCTFHGINLLLQSKGSISLDGDYTYAPDYFKIGWLAVPKSAVYYAINRYKNPIIYVSNSTIKISKKFVPFDVKNLSVKDDNIIMYVEKFTSKGLFEDRASILNGIKNELKDIQSKSSGETEKKKVEGVLKEISDISAGASEKDIARITEELNSIAENAKNDEAKKKAEDIKGQISNTNDAKKRQALSKVSGELQSAASSVTTSGQKQVINMMQSTIGRMISNPSYSYGGDEGAVKAQYSKLSPEEKKALKAAIFSNVDAGTLVDLRSAFGL